MEQAAISKTKPAKPAKRKRSKWKWILLAIVLLAVALGWWYCSSAAQTLLNNILGFDDLFQVERMDLTYSISATGTVVSANSRNVLSTQSYTIEEVLVETGDKVQAGDPLVLLESKALKEQIEKKELSMEATQKSIRQQIKTARDSYNAAKEALELGENSSILTAQNQVTTAYNNWEKAKKAYEDLEQGVKSGLNSQITQSESSVNSAVVAYQTAQSAADSASRALDSARGALAEAELSGDPAKIAEAQKAFSSAQSSQQSTLNSALSAFTSLSNARDSKEASLHGVELSLEDYRIAMDTAYESYLTAQKSLEAAENSAQTQLQSSKNSLEQSRIGANNDVAVYELDQLYEQLEDTTIKAPVSGTVTAVYAKVGNSGSGLLLVIEDTEDLRVETNVKEYDMGVVQAGLPVVIRSDATGEAVIDGQIRSIAPASTKTASGAIDMSGDVLFPTEVGVLTKDSGLKIGMSVRLNYIVEQKKDVLAVPYESVYTNSAGEDCVLVVSEQENGQFLVSEQPIAKGMATDLYIEVEGIAQGAQVINSPESMRAYIGKTIPIIQQSVYSGEGFSMPFMRG